MEIEYLRVFECKGRMHLNTRAHTHTHTHTHTCTLPNSGPLLRFLLELAKALLQPAYFCFLFCFIAEQ